MNDLSNKSFGKWKVIKFDKLNKYRMSYWICECQCSFKTVKSVSGGSLNSGQSTKCRKCHLEQLHSDNSNRFDGKNNPFYGKKHSLETRLQMSKNHADFNGENNPLIKALILDPDIRNKLSENRKNWYINATEEQLKTRSEKLSESMANSEYFKNNSINKKHKSGFFNFKSGRRIFYRSNWEYYVINLLNNLDFVNDIKTEPFVIKYTHNNINKSTRPDILIWFNNNKYTLFEVKPKPLIQYRNNFQKIRSYIEFCKNHKISFRLITNKYINNDNLLTKIIKRCYDKSY